MIGIIITVGWLLIGAVNLCGKNEISKLQYFLVWSVAMAGLVNHYFVR